MGDEGRIKSARRLGAASLVSTFPPKIRLPVEFMRRRGFRFPSSFGTDTTLTNLEAFVTTIE
jgi:hypothetical protein